jgi:hypothetical protein
MSGAVLWSLRGTHENGGLGGEVMDVGAGGQAGYLFVHASYGGGDLGGQGEGWGGVVRG